MSKLQVNLSQLMDARNRQVLLNGLNLVCKDPGQGYLYSLSPEDYQRLYHQGMNVLRLGILWDGVEPSPGRYDDTYLESIRRQLRFAQDAGIRIFLDFHQDLYGIVFGDGAPEWATLSDGLPHDTGEVWSDAYLISPALNQAIEHFWNNTPVQGIGLMDRFLQMLDHVAAYFQGAPNLIGYDIYNEPYPGRQGQAALNAVLESLAASGLKLENAWEKSQLIASLTDMEQYHHLTELLGSYTIPFERNVLTDFYEQAAHAIRGRDPEALIFTEPCYFTNLGAPSGLGRLSVPGQVLAPHGYDLTVDTDYEDLYEPGRVDWIFQQHHRTAQQLGVPVLVGEWGAFYGHAGRDQAAMQMIRILERHLWSHTYWSWTPDIEQCPEWKYLVRGYPLATAGTLLSYTWNTDAFEMLYAPTDGETEIFVPDLCSASWQIQLLNGDAQYRTTLWPDTGHGILTLQAKSGNTLHLRLHRQTS